MMEFSHCNECHDKRRCFKHGCAHMLNDADKPVTSQDIADELKIILDRLMEYPLIDPDEACVVEAAIEELQQTNVQNGDK